MAEVFSIPKQWDKPIELENSVLRDDPAYVKKLLERFGKVEFTARALGLACRFRGLEMVKTLAVCGAKFSYDYETVRRLGQRSSYIYGEKPDENYAACIFGSVGISYIRVYYTGFYKRIPVVPLKERLEVLEYLCDNACRLGLDINELYFFSFFTEEEEMRGYLKERGAVIPPMWRNIVLTGGTGLDEGKDKWFDYCFLAEKIPEGAFVRDMSALAAELGGEKLHFTEYLWYMIDGHRDIKGFYPLLTEKYDLSKVNKGKMLESAVKSGSVEGLCAFAELGWLKTPKKRDQIIQLSSELGKTECTAWLLDFKNRTADFAAERLRAEKRQTRELNMDPNSVTALRRLWKLEKRPDGTIVILGYKGKKTEVTVPERIGGDTVTALGEYAFSPDAKRITAEQRAARAAIVKIILPDTITEIGEFAFCKCKSLGEIELPKGLSVISKGMLELTGISSIETSGNIRTIGNGAFYWCDKLKTVILNEGVEKLEKAVFYNCGALETAELPRSLRSIEPDSWTGTFYGCRNLTVRLHKGSYAEEYCLEMKIPYVYIEGLE